MSLKYNLAFSFLIRLLLIIYGLIHDKISAVKFTDIDYHVFNDGASYIAMVMGDNHSYKHASCIIVSGILPVGGFYQ